MSATPERRPLLYPERDPLPDDLSNAANDNEIQDIADPNLEQHSSAKTGACALNFFLSGIAMAAVGALLPEFEHHYSINDTQAALVFPAGVAGYVLATSTTNRIQTWQGRRGVGVASSSIRLLFAAVLSFHPVFPVFLASFAGLGYGTGLTDTAWNAWASSMPHPNVVQGILHGSFSVGCAAGPLMVTAALRKSSWSLFYTLLSSLLCFEFISQLWAFRNDTKRGVAASVEGSDIEAPKSPNLFRSRSLWLCGIFYLVYQGIEASFTDWIVIFLIRARDTDAATAASASSIFWVGMAIGRYALGAVSERMGLRSAVALYILAAGCAQVVLLAIDQVTVTLVVLGVCGFFLAPLFPSGIVLLVSQTPPQDRVGMVAAVIAMGQIGGAIVPFGMGLLATHLGIQYLMHVTLGLSVALLVLWAIVSRLGG